MVVVCAASRRTLFFLYGALCKVFVRGLMFILEFILLVFFFHADSLFHENIRPFINYFIISYILIVFITRPPNIII